MLAQQKADETRKQGRTPCDVCSGPATVHVRSLKHHFMSFRCDACAKIALAWFDAHNEMGDVKVSRLLNAPKVETATAVEAVAHA
jgi:hypothetical protein